LRHVTKSAFPVARVVTERGSPAVATCLPYIGPVPRAVTHLAVWIPAAVIVMLVGAGVWFWTRAGESTQISSGAALAEYGTPGGRTVAGPRAGAWTYTARGSETVGLGPLRVTRDLPANARIVVRPAEAGFWRTLALSEEHVESTRFAVSGAGTRAVSRSTKLTVGGLGRTDDVDLVPPPLIYPRTLKVGAHWRLRYALRDMQVDARVRVTGRAVVPVDGQDVPVFVIRTNGGVTGPIAGRRDDTEWYAPSLAMPARLVLRMNLSGDVSLRLAADLRLASTAPVN
jgi:hypothetical protein